MNVIKIGGSVLRDHGAYAHVARLLARRDAPWIAVLSAAGGVTDRLLAHDVEGLFEQHQQWAAAPLPPALGEALRHAAQCAAAGHTAHLLAWGEQASVVVLSTHLEATGVAVDVAELGNRLPAVPRLLVPGFYQKQGGEIIVLSRGASDISAVDVAIETDATEVQFWKDGGGIVGERGVLATTEHVSLLQRIGDTIRPLHPEAVRRAARAGIRLRLEDPWCRYPGTVVA